MKSNYGACVGLKIPFGQAIGFGRDFVIDGIRIKVLLIVAG